jgi:hypothetical protein
MTSSSSSSSAQFEGDGIVDKYLRDVLARSKTKPSSHAASTIIIGKQTTSTADALLKQFTAPPSPSSDDVRQTLDMMIEAFRKEQKPRDPNWGKCDISCIENGHVIDLAEKNTFMCRAHMRRHVCDPIIGDDHPILEAMKHGAHTCLFSGYVVRNMHIMSMQDYSKTDPSSRMELGEVDYYGKYITEREVREPIMPERKRAREEDELENEDDDFGCPARKRFKVKGIVSKGCDDGMITHHYRSKSSLDVVRTRTAEVLSKLCNIDKRKKICEHQAVEALKEAKKKISTYVKQSHRKKFMCVAQEKEVMVWQSWKKHERYVPNITHLQKEMWMGIIELMWQHFASYRKTPRPASDLAKDPSAGVLPFIFGCLYGMAEGFVYNNQILLEQDPSLVVVMPPACDLEEFGYKYQYKSAGKKAVIKAVDTSIDSNSGAVQAFLASVVGFTKYMAEKAEQAVILK